MLKLIHHYFEEVIKIKKFDLTIIGGGPVGLFAARFAHLHGLKTVLFDSLSETGGQPQMLYPFKKIKDIPAYDSITGTELIDNLRHNLTDTTIFTNHKVENVTKQKDGFIIDDIVASRSILITTGAGAFKPKALPLSMDDDTQKRIHYFIKDPQNLSDKQLASLVAAIQH